MSFQRQAYKAFTKAHRLTLTGQASRYLEYLFLEYELDREAMADALTRTAQAIVTQHRKLKRGERVELMRFLGPTKPGYTTLTPSFHGTGHAQIVSEELVKEVVQSLISEQGSEGGQENEVEAEERALELVSPFTLFRVLSCTMQDMPGSHYEVARGRFIPSTDVARSVLGESREKARLWQDRYHILLNRLCRTKGYTNQVDEVMDMGNGEGSFISQGNRKTIFISTISSLRGRTREVRHLLGMMNQREEGFWVLEDPEDYVPVNFTNAVCMGGEWGEWKGRLDELTYIHLPGWMIPGV